MSGKYLAHDAWSPSAFGRAAFAAAPLDQPVEGAGSGRHSDLPAGALRPSPILFEAGSPFDRTGRRALFESNVLLFSPAAGRIACRARTRSATVPDVISQVSSPRIALVETDPERASPVIAALHAAGWTDIAHVSETRGLARRIESLRPDIVLIDLADPSRDALESLSLASGATERPVAMFVDRTDPELTRSALEAGLSAYVVAGLDPERVKSVIETAAARFAVQRSMRAELDAAKAALEERKTVDRAKGILMRAKGIGEAEAYALLRKSAMDRGLRIGELARSIVAAADLLG